MINKQTNKNKLTEAIPNLSGNSSITIDIAEVSQAAPPNAPSALTGSLTRQIPLELKSRHKS